MVERKKKHILNNKMLRNLGDFACTLPALSFIVVFTYIPLIQLFYYSLTDWNLLNSNLRFIGAENYEWLFVGNGSKYLWASLKITIIYTIGVLFFTVIGGLLLALVFSNNSKVFRILRPMVFFPRYISTSCAAVVFLWILNTNNGILNQILGLIDLEKVDWLGQRGTALFTIIVISGWKNIGYGMLIYLSAMSGIPKMYYEAASLDGASKIKQFITITLPALIPTIQFLLITSFIASMKAFQTIDIMTEGGPFRTTEVIVYLIYRYAMIDFRMGRASAISIILLIIISICTYLIIKIRKWEGDEINVDE